MQNEDETHFTLCSRRGPPAWASLGVGVAWIFQAVPFQCSASV